MEKGKPSHPAVVFLGVLVMLSSSLTFMAVGWQTLSLNCIRSRAGGMPSCEVQNGYLLGLFKTSKRHVDEVADIERQVSFRGGGRSRLASTVVLQGRLGEVPVLQGSSDTNDEEKKRIVQQVKGFLAAEGQTSFHLEMTFSNIFGWVGLCFLIAAALFLASSAMGRARR